MRKTAIIIIIAVLIFGFLANISFVKADEEVIDNKTESQLVEIKENQAKTNKYFNKQRKCEIYKCRNKHNDSRKPECRKIKSFKRNSWQRTRYCNRYKRDDKRCNFRIDLL